MGPSQASRDIVSGTVHPNYDPNTDSFDLMVLKLGSPASGVPTIGLNDQGGTPSTGGQLQVIGVGDTAEEGSESDGLRKATVNYIETAECNTLYEGGIDDSMMYVSIDIAGLRFAVWAYYIQYLTSCLPIGVLELKVEAKTVARVIVAVQSLLEILRLELLAGAMAAGDQTSQVSMLVYLLHMTGFR